MPRHFEKARFDDSRFRDDYMSERSDFNKIRCLLDELIVHYSLPRFFTAVLSHCFTRFIPTGELAVASELTIATGTSSIGASWQASLLKAVYILCRHL